MVKRGPYAGAHNSYVRKPQMFTKKVVLVLSFFVCYLSPAESYESTNRAEANFELMLHITSMPAALLQITRQNGHGFLSKTYSKLTFIG